MGWGFQGSDMVTPVDDGRGWSGRVKDENDSKHPHLWLELAKIVPFERNVIQGTGPLPDSHAASSRAKTVAKRSRSERSDSSIEQRNNLDIAIELARFGPVDGTGADAGAENAEEMSPQGSCEECLSQVDGALEECRGKEECCQECGVKWVASFELAVVGSLKKHPNAKICDWAPSHEGPQRRLWLGDDVPMNG